MADDVDTRDIWDKALDYGLPLAGAVLGARTGQKRINGLLKEHGNPETRVQMDYDDRKLVNRYRRSTGQLKRRSMASWAAGMGGVASIPGAIDRNFIREQKK